MSPMNIYNRSGKSVIYSTTGEVIIWDLNKDDDVVVASSGIGDDSHREPACKVQWIPDPESKGKKYHVSISSFTLS